MTNFEGTSPEIFNTSEPEYRYKELKELISPGDDFRQKAYAYDEELKNYLKRHLSESAIYLLLVTPRSLDAHSGWIEFEMHAAREVLGTEHRRFFMPCVAGGATLRELPTPANLFQGIELDGEPRSIHELARHIDDVLREGR